MIYLNLSQSNIIIDLLKLHSTQPDQEALLQLIQDKAAVRREIAEFYLTSWKHNHKDGWIESVKQTIALVGEDNRLETIGVIHEQRTKQPTAPREGSIIQQIITLHIAGKTNAEIIALGYNKSTVGRQVGEYKKGKR